MTIIPARPSSFTADGAPPGVSVDLTAFKAEDGTPWYLGRPIIEPRLQLVHTNAARGEGSLQSQINWGNASPVNTKPHYAVNAPQPTKLVPTDRRAIANSTVNSYEGSKGDVSYWSIAIETADAGFPTPGESGGFLYDHAEIVARILAYESIVWSIPLDYPSTWYGPGTACHTEPFGYPYWTIRSGKTCPGAEKKRQVRDEILPRARLIRAAWTDPVIVQPPENIPGDESMKPSHLKRYPGIGVFNGDTLLLTTNDDLPQIVDGAAKGGPYDGVPVIDSDPADDTQFLSVLHTNGPVAAFELGKRAQRNT